MTPHLFQILQVLMVIRYGTVCAIPSVSLARDSSSPDPDFVEPMGNVTVPVGREAVLSCTVSNLAQYKVGWMKADDQTILSLHTRVITHNPRISVTHDDNLRTWQLRIRQLKESDRGCYMCQINTNSMKKQLGCVDVQVPPDIDDGRTSGDKTVAEGDNVTLTCEATGHPKPRILWRREDGDHILLAVKPQELQKVDSYIGSSLNLVRLQRRQMGAYLCIASNDVPPAVSKRIVLNINFHPTVQVQTPLTGALQGTGTKLKCDVEAFPAPSNYWIKEQDGVLLNGSKYRVEEKFFDYRFIMVLVILNVSSTDFGTYTCVSTNIVGKDSGSIRLYEIRRPTTLPTSTTTTTESFLFLEILSTPPSTELALLSNTIGTAAKTPEEDSSENLLYPSIAPRQLELETHSRTVSVVYHSNSVLAFLMSMYVLR